MIYGFTSLNHIMFFFIAFLVHSVYAVIILYMNELLFIYFFIMNTYLLYLNFY
jgi:hypothetical protein